VDRRADGNLAPLQDAPVEVGDSLPDFLLAAQVRDHIGEALDLPAQPQRRRQELLGRHPFPQRVVPRPGLPEVPVPGRRLDVQRLAPAGQVVEQAALVRVADLPVDPRLEAHALGLAFRHRLYCKAIAKPA
jgi:hypothetical protein